MKGLQYLNKKQSLAFDKPRISLFPLQPITKQVIQRLQSSETVIQTMVQLEDNSQIKYRLKLKDQYILFYQKMDYQCEPTFFIRLDFSLVFQKILSIADKTNTPNYKKNKQMKGFKLIHQNGGSICFYIKFRDLTNIWIRSLSRYINELGFHQYFKPIRKLGKGASASVYQIVKLENGQRLAAKLYSKLVLKNNHQKCSSYRNQINILRNIQHKNLLKFVGVFETEQSLYVVVQVLNGGNLFEYLLKRKTHLRIEEARKIMRNLMQGLAQLQKLEIVHRDIKLQNIMVRQRDTLETIIVDFGLAVFSWENQYIKTCGTPGYLSPQVVKDEIGQSISSKSDVFSAGIVFHVLLMGKYLFEGKDPETVFKNNKNMSINLLKPEYINLDKNAYDLLNKMLVLNPEQRISASECLEHAFLRQEVSQKIEVSPASTDEDYHF